MSYRRIIHPVTADLLDHRLGDRDLIDPRPQDFQQVLPDQEHQR